MDVIAYHWFGMILICFILDIYIYNNNMNTRTYPFFESKQFKNKQKNP